MTKNAININTRAVTIEQALECTEVFTPYDYVIAGCIAQQVVDATRMITSHQFLQADYTSNCSGSQI